MILVMSEIVEQIVVWATEIISTLGYVGVAFLVALETVVPPIPSEIILPLAGSLSATGRFNIVLVIIAATIGSVGGASFLYGISRWAGETRVESWIDRYGKWILLSRNDLDRSRQWFSRHGGLTVLIARVIPTIRSLVSIPAGLSSMPFLRFLIFTTIGSLIWNVALVGAGYLLGDNWEQVEVFFDPISPFIYGGIILAVLLFIGKRLWDRLRPKAEESTQ